MKQIFLLTAYVFCITFLSAQEINTYYENIYSDNMSPTLYPSKCIKVKDTIKLIWTVPDYANFGNVNISSTAVLRTKEGKNLKLLKADNIHVSNNDTLYYPASKDFTLYFENNNEENINFDFLEDPSGKNKNAWQFKGIDLSKKLYHNIGIWVDKSNTSKKCKVFLSYTNDLSKYYAFIDDFGGCWNIPDYSESDKVNNKYLAFASGDTWNEKDNIWNFKIQSLGFINGHKRYYRWSDWGGSYKHYKFDLIKDRTDELAEVVNKLDKLGLTLRYTINEGKIGTDYVPPTYSYYNAGKKYKIGDTEIQEQDYRKYVTGGDYNKEITGYTAVYQIINQSGKNYVVQYKASGTTKMSDVGYSGFLEGLLTLSSYSTKYNYTQSQNNNTVLLTPSSNIKEQLILGIEKLPDFCIDIESVQEVSNNWVVGLQNALSGKDKTLVQQYLNDPLASAWYTKLTQVSKEFQKQEESLINTQYSKFVKVVIKPENAATFDKDFDSKVTITISNQATINLKVRTQTKFGTYDFTIPAKSQKSETYVIKGIDINDLNNFTVKLLTNN